MTIPLKPGMHIQVYRGSAAFSQAKLEAFAELAPRLGVVGLIAHGFVGELTPKRYGKWAELCAKHGLQSSAVFGLGEVGGNAKMVGRRIAAVAKMPEAAATGFNMEGAWEDERNDLDEAHAMFGEYRSIVPDAWTFDQPWPMPLPRIHGMPIWWEIARYLNARFPQFYWNNLRRTLGDRAYQVMRPRYETAWEWFHTNRKAPHPPRFVTVQGYYWVLWTLVDALLRYATTTPLVMWSDAFPTEDTMLGMRAVVALRDRGFHGPGAVAAFQRAHGQGLTVDDKCGPNTLAALGF